jgi:uncharacterized phiE125 gp8 family phage protein
MIVVQTAPPATYPVDLATVRAQLSIDTNDYDARLAGLIATATEMVEVYIGRALITRSCSGYLNWWQQSPEGHTRAYLEIATPPLISVSAITTYDDADTPTVFAASNYYVDTVRTPGRVMLRRAAWWPLPTRMANGIQVDFIAGYGAAPGSIPEQIRLAIQIIVAGLNEQRGDEIAPGAMPPAAISLLSSHLVWPTS